MNLVITSSLGREFTKSPLNDREIKCTKMRNDIDILPESTWQ